MPAVMRACATVERAGISALAIGGAGFEGMGRAIGRSMGISHVPIVSYPGVILTDDTEVFLRKMSETVAPQVVDGLLKSTATISDDVPDDDAEPTDREVVFSGSLAEVQEFFHEKSWTDGLPIIPPTIEAANEFLRHTDRPPDEVMGHLLPDLREATIWNVAVNGVMAGCRPEYMPVLVGIVECLLDPVFRIQDAGSTPGWEPLVILSGPVVNALGFNSGTGVMRIGRQANSSVGRFVRLYMRNVPGLRIAPDHTDQGAIATSFNAVLAENDRAVEDLGWSSFRADKGFDRAESVVSVRSCVTISAPIYTGGDTAEDHLRTLALIFGNAMGPWSYTGFEFGEWHPVLVLGPSIARALEEHGVGKDDLRRYLAQNMTISVDDLNRYAWQVGSTSFSVDKMVESGELAASYGPVGDASRHVPMCPTPDCIDIVVAGNESRNQSRGYVQNHVQGVPVSRSIAFRGTASENQPHRRTE
ncbi:hypothetical protein CLV47_102282 [Antricoccus suffuscus]|uniref:Uncharacterized protein n=1 Tax=Antricoccus suffuscus TaxID=1629062 RepID=A0A2T1A4R5_9ACTN|nr:hypothetical protein [Antricoccus suffuscus]PRZ43592.1 hypothetical protein CLV47_102282 [Antricoccus suffuscus]